MLASLLLNVESGILIIRFENLTVSYFWLLISWWYFSFLQRLSKNIRYSVHNVNAYVNTFSFSFKLLLGENTFLWNISGELLRVDILQKSYSERFSKISQKTPLKLEESLFLLMLQTLYLKLYKYAS